MLDVLGMEGDMLVSNSLEFSCWLRRGLDMDIMEFRG